MYIMITNVVGEKRTDVTYLIWGKDDNGQYQIREPVKALLIMDKEKKLPKEMFTDSELNAFAGRKAITILLNINENVFKMNKLAGITKVVISLDELDNTDNLEDGRLSNVLLRYHVTGYEDFTHLEPVTSSIRNLKTGSSHP